MLKGASTVDTGPLVVKAPPNVIGMFTDFFQRTITDVGAIGPDRARGGLYLLLPQDGLCHPRFLDLPAASSPLRLLVHPAETPQPPKRMARPSMHEIEC